MGVHLPEPLNPTMASVSPGSRENEIFLSAGSVEPGYVKYMSLCDRDDASAFKSSENHTVYHIRTVLLYACLSKKTHISAICPA